MRSSMPNSAENWRSFRSSSDARRPQLVDLYKRVIDGVAELGFPLSVHFEVPYGLARPAFETFAEMLGYWSPAPAAS